jgi:hypothetical protein
MVWNMARPGMEQVKYMGIASNLLEGPFKKKIIHPFLMREDMTGLFVVSS